MQAKNMIIVISTGISVYHLRAYHITNLQRDQLPVGLNNSAGGAPHRYRRGHGFESRSSLNFFRLEFHRINPVFLKNILLLTMVVVLAQMLAISHSHFVVFRLPIELTTQCALNISKDCCGLTVNIELYASTLRSSSGIVKLPISAFKSLLRKRCLYFRVLSDEEAKFAVMSCLVKHLTRKVKVSINQTSFSRLRSLTSMSRSSE